MDVNYKNPKRYKTAKYPIRQPWCMTLLIRFLSWMMLIGKKHKVERIGMEGLKPPYVILSNHMAFVDFELAAKATFPNRINNVVTIDGFYRRAWLMELIGAICTRRFTTDFHLIKSIRKVLKRGDILCMYPEAKYSLCGIPSYIPDTLGRLIKRNKVPVVITLHRGNYLHAPFWNARKKRKVPMRTTMELLFTAKDVERLSVDELNEKLREALDYDEYRYQKENGILIKEPYRAEGLHNILYKCPHCLTEARMSSKGTILRCDACGHEWHMNEDSSLVSLSGETVFSYIPDWFRWERRQVEEEIDRGEYSFSDTVEVHSFPRCYAFIPLGKATLTHDPENGFILTGFYRGKEYRIHRAPLRTIGLHVEYAFSYLKYNECIDISTEDDSYYCIPTKKNMVTKLALATEIIYQKKYKQIRKT